MNTITQKLIKLVNIHGHWGRGLALPACQKNNTGTGALVGGAAGAAWARSSPTRAGGALLRGSGREPTGAANRQLGRQARRSCRICPRPTLITGTATPGTRWLRTPTPADSTSAGSVMMPGAARSLKNAGCSQTPYPPRHRRAGICARSRRPGVTAPPPGAPSGTAVHRASRRAPTPSAPGATACAHPFPASTQPA